MKNPNNKLRLFDHLLKARFLTRPNRFLVKCEWEGQILSAFLPNPGRLQELFFPGRVIYLVREEENPGRKTLYTAVAVEREGQPIMLHTFRTNEVARYLIEKGQVPGLESAKIVKSEFKAGHSRFDFLLKEGDRDILLEVKSCTLVGKEVAMFPDAVTERGARHLRELAEHSEEGMGAAVLFVVHWPFARVFMPDYHTDLHFSQTLLSVRNRIKVISVAVNWDHDLSVSSDVRLLQIPWNYIGEEAKDRGSYLLILELKRKRKIEIGKLGGIFFKNGFYIYVGSAMANLSKRMERHRHLRKHHHWHIDELRAVTEFHSVLAIRSSTRLECEIAKAFSDISEWKTPGFGCTDCTCDTHLFGMESDPLHSEKFQKLLQYFRMDRNHSNSPSPPFLSTSETVS